MRQRCVRWIGFLLCLASLPVHAGVEEAVVKIGGCSGVCVDPEGLVLTARHCDLPDVVRVEFPERTASARRIYATSDTEGPVVYDCDGAGFPYAEIADSVPPVRSRVWSAGYPQLQGQRPLRRAAGILLTGGTFEFRGGAFRGNIVGFPTGSGWSGGPLFNARGEVCGLLSSGDCDTSVFISFAATKHALELARHERPREDRPTLYVFGSLSCVPCKQFRQDYERNGDLRRRLDAAFHVVFVDVDRRQSTASDFGVTDVPAFVIAGGERVVGYEGADELLVQLGVTEALIAEAPRPVPERDPVTAPAAPVPATPVEQPAAPPITVPPVAAPVAAAPIVRPPVTAPIPVTLPAENPPQLDDRRERVMRAAQTALAITQWLGITGAAGGVGGLVLGGIALLRTFCQARRGRSARDPPIAKPSVVTVDAPPLPQAIVPETRFAPYERDTFAEAFAWAETEMARKYPGAVGTLESLRGLIDQYLSAKGVVKTPTTTK